jgi:hypothetical protein
VTGVDTRPVRLTVAPGAARLAAWGNTDGNWFGLILWTEHVRDTRRPSQPPTDLACSGWLHSTHLAAAGDLGVTVPRLQLPADRRSWPTPADLPGSDSPRDGLHFGVMHGGPVHLPPTLQRVSVPDPDTQEPPG